MMYMLEKDMGSAGEFDYRRTELKLLHDQADVSDEEVIASYEAGLQPVNASYSS